jgi:hypothetical protein
VLSKSTDTQFDAAFSAIVLFNPLGSTRHDLVEVDLNIPEGIAAFDLIDENSLPYILK